MYNSQLLDTKRVSTTWKLLLAVLSITFIWQTITTKTYANVLPKSVAAVELSKQTVTYPPVISKEAVIEDPATQTVTPPPAISKEAATEQKPATPKFLSLVKTGEKIQYSDRDLFCLAKNIYHESRGEPIKGRYAVAQVTINRTQDPRFKGSICDVVFAPYQFSWANNRSRRWTTPQSASWKEARHIAIDVLENGKRLKGMEEALYFHSKHVNPNWRNLDRLTRIGSHIFYEQNS